jgi:hypothetical protein
MGIGMKRLWAGTVIVSCLIYGVASNVADR